MSEGTEVTPADTLVEIQRRELLEQLDERKRARRRHLTWALLGVSPGALVPLFVSLSAVGVSALVGAVGLMTGVEAWRAWRARRDVVELKDTLESLYADEEVGPAT